MCLFVAVCGKKRMVLVFFSYFIFIQHDIIHVLLQLFMSCKHHCHIQSVRHDKGK